MTTRANIEAAVYTWVQGATGVTTIFADQAEPRPATPYMTIKLGGPIAVGHDEERSLSDPGAPSYATMTYRGDREVTVSVQAFGAGALDLARAAARGLVRETVRQELATAGLCHRGVVPTVNELTNLLETDFQERAQFDAVLAFGEEHTDQVPLIEDVEGQGTYTQPPKPDRVVPFVVNKP